MTGTSPSSIAVDARIGAWRILRIVHKRALCVCKCGATHEVAIDALAAGESTSCGCSPLSLPKNINRVVRLPSWKPERGR